MSKQSHHPTHHCQELTSVIRAKCLFAISTHNPLMGCDTARDIPFYAVIHATRQRSPRWETCCGHMKGWLVWDMSPALPPNPTVSSAAAGVVVPFLLMMVIWGCGLYSFWDRRQAWLYRISRGLRSNFPHKQQNRQTRYIGSWLDPGRRRQPFTMWLCVDRDN